jgi:hypothetical protein
MASSHGTDRVSARRDLGNNPGLVLIAPCPPPSGTGEHFQPADRLGDSTMFSVLSLTVKTRPQTRRSGLHPEGDRSTPLTIAAHMRMSGNHKHTTVAEHMPSSHRRYAGWTIERIRADARLIGPATAALCELILSIGRIQNRAFAPVWGSFGWPARMAPGVSRRRRTAPSKSGPVPTVRSILDNHLDRRPAQKRATDGTPILHSNIRGPRYYN